MAGRIFTYSASNNLISMPCDANVPYLVLDCKPEDCIHQQLGSRNSLESVNLIKMREMLSSRWCMAPSFSETGVT